MKTSVYKKKTIRIKTNSFSNKLQEEFSNRHNLSWVSSIMCGSILPWKEGKKATGKKCRSQDENFYHFLDKE